VIDFDDESWFDTEKGQADAQMKLLCALLGGLNEMRTVFVLRVYYIT
jgi:hypothetical protein